MERKVTCPLMGNQALGLRSDQNQQPLEVPETEIQQGLVLTTLIILCSQVRNNSKDTNSN